MISESRTLCDVHEAGACPPWCEQSYSFFAQADTIEQRRALVTRLAQLANLPERTRADEREIDSIAREMEVLA